MRLIVGLCEWQCWRLVSALSLSVGAVSFFVVSVGLVLLPADVEKLTQPLYLSITHSHVLPAQQAVSLVWYMPRGDRQGWRHQLIRHDLINDRPTPQMLWPELLPSAIGPGTTSEILFAGCWDGSLWRLDLSQATAPQKVGTHAEPGPQQIICSADGRWLATLAAHYLQVLDLATGQPAWKHGDSQSNCVALHPDSRRMLVSHSDGRLVELELQSGRELRTVAQLEGPAVNVSISPNARLIAVITAGGGSHLLHWETGLSAWPADWRDAPHFTRSAIAQFSPCGERLITSGRDTMTLAVWNLRTMQLEGELRGHDKAINGVAFLGDGRLCSFGADGTFRIWNLEKRTAERVQSININAQAS